MCTAFLSWYIHLDEGQERREQSGEATMKCFTADGLCLFPVAAPKAVNPVNTKKKKNTSNILTHIWNTK